MSNALEKLFGGANRIKIMRLFLLNQDLFFDAEDVSKRSKVGLLNTRKELKFLENIGFVKKKGIKKEILSKSKKKLKKTVGYYLNNNFQYKEALRGLLSMDNFLKKGELTSRFKGHGKIKLLVVAGAFLQNKDCRVDLLVVGDNLNKKALEDKVKTIESELGQELCYAIFDTNEFIYRMNMYDKLIRDILDFPNEHLIDTGEIST
ncbi:MAG: hypothetical protein US50_C0030G0004 [Candidatus Nomurabacteria bacterium GW2011_GWB1_37_5]|uniref:Transcriptional regulator n=1 Tax=Candidatus Nomurabacteria bacterium GW2011_GWB1_37_5 TaxID=1618742 RepID=A0A0G0GY13_9BACT|nr:MAG: hypothetical protein US50_C0030G0004 [Candidatus Nomurabacteria bacterium GW2011_GWB1_37_5]